MKTKVFRIQCGLKHSEAAIVAVALAKVFKFDFRGLTYNVKTGRLALT